MKKLHLICNAHLDPIWLWEWEEGASAALSTFRSAADLCEQFDYVFCHNEVTLYKYIEEYEPQLFEQIKQLVKLGKWRIMGGWYLQPDCNMPSGESIVRQIRVGNKYFQDKFGVTNTTAINFDPFGHGIGLVQILTKCGYDSYMCCRPSKREIDLPHDEFLWQGLDGSTLKAARVSSNYNSGLGHAVVKIDKIVKDNASDVGVVLWGVGNHGGGPSRQDLVDIAKYIESSPLEIVHSTPEQYFKDINPTDIVTKSLQISMPGCYTSQVLIKQKHRQLENNLFMTEKMCSHASIEGLIGYPQDELSRVTIDLLNSQFHDILPGTSIKPGEDNGIRILEHGLEELNKLRAKAFFALSSGQAAAKEGEYPILVYNPHPLAITTTVEVEFQLADQNWGEIFTQATVYKGELQLPTQQIKEECTLNLDWRKKLLFECQLAPSCMNRFDIRTSPKVSQIESVAIDAIIEYSDKQKSVAIDTRTGQMTSYKVKGTEYLASPIALYQYLDNADPWGMATSQLKAMGTTPRIYSALSELDSSKYAGVDVPIASTRIIENGSVAMIVESLVGCDRNRARILYTIYKEHDYIDISVTIDSVERNQMTKLHIPTTVKGKYLGQVQYGIEELFVGGEECVAQKWTAAVEPTKALAIVNKGIYGSSYRGGTIMLSLLRTPAYAAHPIEQRALTPQDRFLPHIDIGERKFEIRLTTNIATVEKQSTIFNEVPYALNVFPSGQGKAIEPLATLDNEQITMTTFKSGETVKGYIIRLHNNTANNQTATITIKNKSLKINFTKFEIVTLQYNNAIIKQLDNLVI